MNENNVWKIIELLNWYKDYDSERCYLELRSELKNQNWNIEVYRDYVGQIYDNLHEVLEKHNLLLDPDGGYGLGDDSFADLVGTVISKGKDFHDKVIRDNNIALKMAESSDYEQGFSDHYYSVDDSSDYGQELPVPRLNHPA